MKYILSFLLLLVGSQYTAYSQNKTKNYDQILQENIYTPRNEFSLIKDKGKTFLLDRDNKVTFLKKNYFGLYREGNFFFSKVSLY